MNKELAVIMLQYNSSDLTEDLLRSAERFESEAIKDYRWILMDNDSRNDRFEYFSSKFPWVELVKYDVNLGFAKAHNRVMETIREPWVLLLNNDCILQNNAITLTLRSAKQYGADFATCCVLNSDFTHQNNHSTLPTPLRRVFINTTGMARLISSIRRRLPASRVGYINGAFLLLKKDSIPRPSLFNERFFFYMEDLDLIFRLSKEHRVGYRFSAGRVVHLGGGSAKRSLDEQQIRNMKGEQNVIGIWKEYFPLWQSVLAEKVLFYTRWIRLKMRNNE
ncbi:MAG: glycosyltransferase family 2 protein [Candidatus Thiodiazotropha sp.]